jgi:hypothetical protein
MRGHWLSDRRLYVDCVVDGEPSMEVSVYVNIPASDSSHMVLSICIKVFGFFSVLSTIPYVSRFASRLWIMKEDIKYYDKTGKIYLASAGIATALYIGVGLSLIFRSDKIAQKLSPELMPFEGEAVE